MDPKSVFTLLVAVLMLAPYAVADGAEITDSRYLSIQDAIDDAKAGDAILVEAVPSGAPLPEALVIDEHLTGLVLCAVDDTGADKPVSIGVPADCPVPTDARTANTIVDSSSILANGKPATTVLTIKADDVVVQGLTLRWTVQYAEELLGTDANDPLLPSGPNTNPADLIAQTQKGLSGVVVESDNVQLLDNVIQMRGGLCAAGVSPCNTPVPTTGVFITKHADAIAVSGNLIEVSIKADEGTVAGDAGILAAGSAYNITGNLFKYWAGAGVRVTENAAGQGTIFNNTFEANVLYGVHIQRTDLGVLIDDNTFRNNDAAAILLEDSDHVVVSNNDIQPGLSAPMTGVWVRGADDVRITANTFAPLPAFTMQPGFGVTVGADDKGDAPLGLVLRENVFNLAVDTLTNTNQYALLVGPDVQTTTVDARLNDWGVYTWGKVSARVLDAGVTNTVQILPYIEA